MGRERDSQAQIEFTHDEPATFPRRTYSGQHVRLNIIRSMSASHETFKSASSKADELIQLLRRVVRHDSFPPTANMLRAGGQIR